MGKRMIKRQMLPPKWKICTEGVTEANYLRKYMEALGVSGRVDVCCKKQKASGCGKQHERLFDQMQNCAQNWDRYEKIFLVHDYDKAAEIPVEKKRFNAVFERKGEIDGLHIIYSNPCFEYWLMLHLAYHSGDLHRNEYQRRVKEYCNQKRAEENKEPLHKDGYKSDPDLFTYFGGLDGAEQAAGHAMKRFEEIEAKNRIRRSKDQSFPFATAKYAAQVPCTNFFELLEELKTLAK